MFHLVSLIITLCLTVPALADCHIYIAYADFGNLKEPQPLVLNEDGLDFVYPSRARKLILRTGQSIVLACPGTNNEIAEIGGQEVVATCRYGTNFDVNNTPRDFSSITCKNNPEFTAMAQSEKCLGNKTTIAVGFLFPHKFVTTYEVCRDDSTYETYYSKFKMIRPMDGQYSYPRPKMWEGAYHFHGMNMEEVYSWEHQRTVIGNILGRNSPLVRRINRYQFLSRGHLTARADFVYGSQQTSTFCFVNAAPQWYSFNSKNWEVLESSIREFTRVKSVDLEIYTGVHGKMTMPDIYGNQRVIEITAPSSKPLLVPKFFWKIMYHRPSRKGIAFVGLNDPFVTSDSADLYLCYDTIAPPLMPWISWSSEYSHGLLYACTVDDLRKSVPTIPPLTVVDILS